jgi:transposase-like protein
MPRRYPPEFRRKVLDLLKAGRSVIEVASDLEISTQTIYNWRRQDLIDSGLKKIRDAGRFPRGRHRPAADEMAGTDGTARVGRLVRRTIVPSSASLQAWRSRPNG